MRKGSGLLLFLCIVAVVAALLACVGFFFSAKEYTVTFESNGGSFVAGCVVGEGKTAPRPVSPVRDGYAFRGWYYDRSLSNEYSFDTPVNSDMTLYAGWKEYVDVSASVVAETKTLPEPAESERTKAVQDVAAVDENKTVSEDKAISETAAVDETAQSESAEQLQGTQEVAAQPEAVAQESEVSAADTESSEADEQKPETEEKSEPDAVLQTSRIYFDEYVGEPVYEDMSVEIVPAETVVLNSLKATVSGTNTISAKYNHSMPEIILPEKTGYIFGGYWTEQNGAGLQYYRADGSSARNYEGSSLVLYAKWIARDDTVYRVCHYLEGSEGKFILKDTEDLTGVTDATVSAVPRTYAGYAYDSSLKGTLASSNVESDGSLVLRLFYKKDLLTVSFDTSGGSKIAKISGIEYGSNILPPETPVRVGYRFAGWYTNSDFTDKWDFENNTVTTNMTLYSGWYANKDTAYKVCHYLETLDGKYALRDTDNLTRTTGTSVVSVAKNYKGFTFVPDIIGTVAGGTVEGDGSLLLKLFYKRQTFAVNFNTNGGSLLPSVKNVKYGATVAEPDVPENAGYIFAGWYRDSSLKNAWNFGKDVVTGATTLYAKWVAEVGTPYKVYHYLETLDGKFALKEVENLKGTTANTVKAVVKNYQGFTCDSSVGTTTGVVVGDGSLVLKLFYRRQSYTVSYDSVGGSDVMKQTALKYGTLTVAPENPVRHEYSFLGWYKDAEYENEWNFSRDTVTADTVLYAKWQPNSYTIRFDRNGGPEDGMATVYYEDTAAEIGPVTSLAGYTLAGFYTAPSGGMRVLNANGAFASDNVEGYISDGKWYRTEDCTLYIHWFDGKPVGGRIFYVHEDNGAEYEFYDVDGEKITGKQDVYGLADAAYYRIVSGQPKADKFYVYDVTNGPIENVQWGSYKNNRNESVSMGLVNNGIGQGRINTALVLNTKEEDRIDGQSRKSLALKDSMGGYETIWAYVSYMNGENGLSPDGREFSDEFGFTGNRRVRRIAGCRDWYIGSPEEYDKLRQSTLEPSLFEDSKMLWSSVEVNYNDSFSWLYLESTDCFWSNSSKGSYCRALLIRSF